MNEETSDQSCLGQKAIVVGAGLGGLMAAASLSNFFARVEVIEKDTLPSEPALRKGVPQGAHVHTFLGYAVEAMEELLPGLLDRLYEAGAVRIRRNFDIWFHDAAGPTPIRDVGILTPSVTRPLLEHVTREMVLDCPNVNIAQDTRLVDFVPDSDRRINGVEIETGAGHRQNLPADLVVDCSGRGSRLPRWLKQHDYGAVETWSLKIAMGYTSGLFSPPPEWRDSAWACLMLAIPPARRAAYLTPVDGGLWLATMYGRGGDYAPRDRDGFVEWTRGLAHPIIHERLKDAELVSDLSSFKIPTGQWNRYDQMDSFPDGLIPLGEAFTSFNPMYGQGISLSAGQALALRDALRECVADGGGLNGLANGYFNGSVDFNAVGWSVMETRDLAYDSTQGPRPADLEERWRMGQAIRRLAELDPEVHKLTVRVTHLLDPPSSLQDPAIVERANELLAAN